MNKAHLRKPLAVLMAFALSCSLLGAPLAGWATQPSQGNTPGVLEATGNEASGENIPETQTPGPNENQSDSSGLPPSNTPSNQNNIALNQEGSETDPSDQAASDSLKANASQPIVILHTNDVHCSVSQLFDAQGKAQTIGYAGVSTLLKEAETRYGKENVTLVDAGDAIQGKPMGTLSRGSYLIDIMKKVGYDLAIPGNHEFDYSMGRFMELVDQAKTKQAGLSSFDYVSCNFTDLRSNAPVFDPYQTITYPDGTKVAYVGISTPETLTKSSPANFQDEYGNYIYGFCEDETGTALYQRIQTTVDAARAAGANYVVAVGHLGEASITTRWRADTVIQNTSGIDAFIDGHSHEQYEQNIEPRTQNIRNRAGDLVPLAQTGTQLQSVGKIVIDPTSNTLTCSLVTPPVNQDADTLAYVQDIEEELGKVLDQQVARTEVKLIAAEDDARKSWAVRTRETNLGDLCADATRAALDTDIAFSNGGGIRSDVAIGDITYGNAISVMPFGNSLCKIETTGQAILDALEMGSRLYPEPTGGFLQTSGLTYELRSDIPTPVKLDANSNFIGVEGPRRVQNVRVAGQPLDPTKTYTLASISYLLKEGGDGFTMFKGSKIIVDEQGLDYEALITYLKDDLHGLISSDSVYANESGEGRILVKNGPDPAPTPPSVPVPDPDQPVAGQLARTDDPLLPTSAVVSTLMLCALITVACAAHALRRRHEHASS